MKHLKVLFIAILAFVAAACSSTSQADFNVVPKPQVIRTVSGEPFVLSKRTTITYPSTDTALARQASMLSAYISEQSGISTNTSADFSGSDAIRLSSSLSNDNPEAYRISVTAEYIDIEGASDAGTFYGIQTLRKSIPAAEASKVEIPQTIVEDKPHFPYRGMHLDVVRHFFPIDSVKEYIDMLALHNMNRLHWHLTDDQGWRIEIKSRPQLTEVGSKRPATTGTASYMLFDSIPQDGFYTHEELRDIVRYAADRYIEIIPEIDLPGHMQAALASYPELGCTGGPYKVTDCWTFGENLLCLGKEETYKFLDDVFAELTDIFPSKLIHIGGDECNRDVWKHCKACQAMADRLGFRDDSHGTREAKLQNHAMHHVAEFLRSRGRRVIGWDEVLDSDFAPDAVVMSWRGEEGGIEGARRGNDVIMTPTQNLYFDFYQSPYLDEEPLAIGGYISVEDVYNYNPIPEGLTEEEQKHILGAQANVWTEYIPTFSQVQYMTLPRMAALSEVQWNGVSNKDMGDFTARVSRLMDIYKSKGWRYADHIFNVHGKFENVSDGLLLTLSTYDKAPIHFTVDGSEPTLQSPLYTEPIKIDKSLNIKAIAEREGKAGRVYKSSTHFSKATFKPVELSVMPAERYTFEGAGKLTDGILGSRGYADTQWLGFLSPEIDITVDLGTDTEISHVGLRSNVDTVSWIFNARRIGIEVSSDGKNFRDIASRDYPALEGETVRIDEHTFSMEPTSARFVRFRIKTEDKMPDWHPGKGRLSYFFVDEISID